jgi:hypothetical protein
MRVIASWELRFPNEHHLETGGRRKTGEVGAVMYRNNLFVLPHQGAYRVQPAKVALSTRREPGGS